MSAMIDSFAKGIRRVIDVHELEAVPVVYPTRQQRGFGDEHERLEHVLGIDLSQVTLP